METLGPRPELLLQASLGVAKQAEDSTRQLLGRHSDLLTPVAIDLIAEREYKSALEQHARKRYEGRANDNYSYHPGLMLYVTPTTKDLLFTVFKKAEYPVTEDQVIPVTSTMQAIRFPRAIYGMGLGGCQIYLEAAEDWEKSNLAEKPFALGYRDVIRIEGDANELWQNWDYKWDGTSVK